MKNLHNNEIVTAQTVNLTNCDREQIHIPGSIQPHGVLIVLDRKSLKIIQVSQNTQEFLGFSPSELMTKSLTKLLGEAQSQLIESCLNKDFNTINPVKLSLNQLFFNGIIHAINDYIILELEPINSLDKNDFFNFYQMTKGIITQIQYTANLNELCQVIVTKIRELTGFDRVMIYRFDQDLSGHVIAENKREDMESFWGLHYPATDIPQPARKLYLLNLIRLIPDIDYQEVVLPNHPETNEVFDLSFAVLRSVSPIHLEYLKNMGVKASMSISLIHNQKLWGLIACHHYSQPKYVSYEVRTACEFLAQVMSLNLIHKEENQDLDYKMHLNEILSTLLELISQSNNLFDTLIANAELLQRLINAQGVVIYSQDQVHLMGITPSQEEIRDLIEWINTQEVNNLFCTDRLPQIYPNAIQFKNVASGILALALSKINNYFIIWVRPEVIQTVEWAGNPNKDAKVEDDGSITLSPRKSFEQWKETVRNQSLPWQLCEIQQVMELRNFIVGIIFKKADELAEINIELQRSNTELDSFAYVASHDLKEPLRGIFNYSQFLLEDYQSILDEEGCHKLNTLMVLTKRMEQLIDSLLHYSRIGRKELSLQTIDLGQVIKDILIVLETSNQEKIDLRIPKPLPLIEADPVLIQEVFMNLITNGIKYNNSEKKWIEISYFVTQENSREITVFAVKDNGIGIREQHQDLIFRIFKRLHGQNQYGGGTGAGLTIVKKIIERHHGKIWLESTYGEGTTFYFTLG